MKSSSDSFVLYTFPVLCFGWYITTFGESWLNPLLRAGGTSFHSAIFLFLFTSILSLFLHLLRSSKYYFIAYVALPAPCMIIIGGSAVFISNLLAQDGAERLSNSIGHFGISSIFFNMLRSGISSGAWLFGLLLTGAIIISRSVISRR